MAEAVQWDVYTFDGTNWERKRPLQDLDGSWNDDYGKIPRSYAMAFTSTLDGEKDIYAAVSEPKLRGNTV